METIVHQTQHAGWLAPAAYVSLGATTISCVALLMLHLASPEFAPSWRMVSEYANGQHKWLLTVVFIGWALSSFALIGLMAAPRTHLGKFGLDFSASRRHRARRWARFRHQSHAHGPAAMIGIPSLCVAAVLITLAMARRPDISAPPLWAAHLPWMTFALMIGAFVLFFSALKAAGVDMSGAVRTVEGIACRG